MTLRKIEDTTNFLSFFPSLFNQQSEYKVFSKLMGWLVIYLVYLLAG